MIFLLNETVLFSGQPTVTQPLRRGVLNAIGRELNKSYAIPTIIHGIDITTECMADILAREVFNRNQKFLVQMQVQQILGMINKLPPTHQALHLGEHHGRLAISTSDVWGV